MNDINVYDINIITDMKCSAYLNRDRIRDLYDLCFITNRYRHQLDTRTKRTLQDSLGRKGLEQFDYIMNTQQDGLIDNDQLAENVLVAFDALGLLEPEELDETTSEKETRQRRLNELNTKFGHVTNPSYDDTDKPNRPDYPQ